MDVCTARGAQGPACLALAMALQLDAQGAAAAEAAVGSPEAGASTLHGQGCETRINPPSAAKHLGQVGRAVDLGALTLARAPAQEKNFCLPSPRRARGSSSAATTTPATQRCSSSPSS